MNTYHGNITGLIFERGSSLGKKEEVEAYCRELIDFMGYDGGFILGSGCEVPVDAKPENVAALIKSARQ